MANKDSFSSLFNKLSSIAKEVKDTLKEVGETTKENLQETFKEIIPENIQNAVRENLEKMKSTEPEAEVEAKVDVVENTNEDNKNLLKQNYINDIKNKLKIINTKSYDEKLNSSKKDAEKIWMLYLKLKDVYGNEIIHGPTQTNENLNFTEYSIHNYELLEVLYEKDEYNSYKEFYLNKIFPEDNTNYFFSKKRVQEELKKYNKQIIFSILGSVFFTEDSVYFLNDFEQNRIMYMVGWHEERDHYSHIMDLKYGPSKNRRFLEKLYRCVNSQYSRHDFDWKLNYVYYWDIVYAFSKGVDKVFKSKHTVHDEIYDKDNFKTVIFVHNLFAMLTLNLEGNHGSQLSFTRYSTFHAMADKIEAMKIDHQQSQALYDLNDIDRILNDFFSDFGYAAELINKYQKIIVDSFEFKSKTLSITNEFEASQQLFEILEISKLTRLLFSIRESEENFMELKNKISVNSIDSFKKLSSYVSRLYIFRLKRLIFLSTVMKKMIHYKKEGNNIKFYILYNKIEDIGIFTTEFEKRYLNTLGRIENEIKNTNQSLNGIIDLLSDIRSEFQQCNETMENIYSELSIIDNTIIDAFDSLNL